jgi:MazG family protein
MKSINKLHEVMARLRAPDGGCPWDLEQDFSTIAPYTIEEAYEVADAIDRHDMESLRDELGDLLFQVVFHARMAEEQGLFDLEAVADGITQKMLRRHPHVFGTDAERAAGAAEGSWDRIKAEERAESADNSALAGVAGTLPALKRAQKLGKRAAGVGFDWADRQGVEDKIREEMAELDEAAKSGCEDSIEAELGDLLFSIVNLARHLRADPEKALRRANSKFERRFRDMEAALENSGRRLPEESLEALDAAWNAAKRRVG